MDLKGIIDRFEGEFAVLELENGSKSEILRRFLPVTAKEGDVIRQTVEGFVVDTVETEKRRLDIEKLSQDLWI